MEIPLINLKKNLLQEPHGVTSQKMAFFKSLEQNIQNILADFIEKSTVITKKSCV
jgi:hypothetical protein